MADKRILSGIIGIFVILLSIGGYFGYQELAKRWAAPEISGANFSLEYRKIPFDIKSIDITFSTDLDPTSLTTKNVTFSPFIEGQASVKNGNTISYKLDKKLTIGEIYTFTIGSDVRSIYGKELGKEQIFTIEAISGAVATKILPSGKLKNLGQNIIVLFNIPVVPLTNLDERDKLPCPLEITPKVEGKCKWTNGNVLEFIPNKPLEMATKYHLKVSDVPGLLYPLISVLEDDILTPELSISTDTYSFDPVKGMTVMTSAPVDKAELVKNLTLISLSPSGRELEWGLSGTGTNMEVQIQWVKDTENITSDTEYIITPKVWAFLYSSKYTLTIKKGLRPKYGNEPLAEEYIIHPKSADLLSDSQVFRKIYNASGTLSDTREYGKDSYGALIPSKDIFLRLTFLSEIGLDKKLFTLKTSAGKVVDFDIAYVKQDTYDNHHNKTGTKENKQLLDITPKTSLENDTSYQLILSKKANNSLPVDIIKNYQTAKKFQILGQQFLSNTKTCIYMNNGLENEYGYDSYSSQSSIIQTTPVSKIYDLVKDEQMDYYSNTKTYRCTQHPGQISYIIGTRFDPKKDYTITLPAKFEDYYGNAIGKDYSFKVKTGDIAQKDIYLYSSLNNPIQIIPNNLPIVLNLQSINAISANMEVCEMDSGGYMHYLKNRYEKYG